MSRRLASSFPWELYSQAAKDELKEENKDDKSGCITLEGQNKKIMDINIDLNINKFGQDLIEIDYFINYFQQLEKTEKRNYLIHLSDLILQSKPLAKDIEPAINNSKLRPTFTPCVLLKKGVEPYRIQRIIDLPENESKKVLILLLHLFRIAYRRRFIAEKNGHKW